MPNPYIMENDEDFDRLDELIIEEGKKSPSKKILMCPECKSTHVMYYLGAHIGYMYQCKDCGYVGSFVIEK